MSVPTKLEDLFQWEGLLMVEGGAMKVTVICEDTRHAYGREDVQVRPTDGSGLMWVDRKRVEFLHPTSYAKEKKKSA